MKVVLDTNVLISAALWHGRTHELLTLIKQRKLIPCFAESTLSELVRVLSRPKFKVRLDKLGLPIPSVVEKLVFRGEFFKLPSDRPVFIADDPSDDKFLYLAAEAKVEYLVSGDKHLLSLEEFKGIKIVSVGEFLSVIS